MLKANQKVRDTAKAAGIKHWEIANYMGISEPTLVRWLRTPMPDGREKTVLRAIAELAQTKQKEE